MHADPHPRGDTSGREQLNQLKLTYAGVRGRCSGRPNQGYAV